MSIDSATNYISRDPNRWARYPYETESNSLPYKMASKGYRHNSPKHGYLPSMTPPDRRSPSLRGQRYDVVPPLRLNGNPYGEDGEEAPLPSYSQPLYRHSDYSQTPQNGDSNRLRYQRQPVIGPPLIDPMLRMQGGTLPPPGPSNINSNQAPFYVLPYPVFIGSQLQPKSTTYERPRSDYQRPSYYERQPPPHDYYERQMADDLGRDFTDREIRNIANETLREIETPVRNGRSYRQESSGGRYKRTGPLDDVMFDILEEVVDEESIKAVRVAMRQMVDEYLEERSFEEFTMDLIFEVLKDDLVDLAVECIPETRLEVILDDEIIDPIVQEMVTPIAIEALRSFMDKEREAKMKETENVVVAKGLEGVMLDYMMNIVTGNGREAVNNNEANKILDDHLITLLLHNSFDVAHRRKSTINNKPLRRQHEKLFTDVTVDALMGELIQNLDEDMNDIDEYERSLENPATSLPNDVHQWLQGH